METKHTAGASSSSDRMRFEDDILIVRMSGTVGVSELQTMFDMSEVLFERHGYILFLIDARDSKGMTPDARKLHTDRLKRFIRPSHSSIYNVNSVVRVMSTLIQRGTELVAGKTFPVSFHRDEAEARAQLAAQRDILRRGAVVPPR